MSKQRLDIFRTLSNIRNRNVGFYSKLTDDEKKSFAPIVVMKWLGGSDNPAEVVFLNDLVNATVYSLHKHPQLLYNLMIISTFGKQRDKWLKKQSSQQGGLHTLAAIRQYYKCNTIVAKQYKQLLNDGDIMQICEELGFQKNDNEKVKKELKARSNR